MDSFIWGVRCAAAGAVIVPLPTIPIFPGVAAFAHMFLVSPPLPPQTPSAQPFRLHQLMQVTKFVNVCGFLQLIAPVNCMVIIAEGTFSCGGVGVGGTT